MTIRVVIICIIITYSAIAQTVSIQDSVFNLFLDFSYAQNEVKKTHACKNFTEGLRQALSQDVNAELTFDSLKKYRVLIESPDRKVRVFTWDFEAEDNTHTYFGFIHAYNPKQKKYEVFELKDKSSIIRDPENALLDNTKWYGAYYYQIAEIKHKKKKYYVLLGWNGNNIMSDKRIIDVLYFDSKGFPKFGDAIFPKENGKIVKRVIFEFQNGVFMSLKYIPEKQIIIFDHLSPANPVLEGQYEFYGPDFTYDMLELKKGKWVYVKNVDARNPKSKTDNFYNHPR
jgi:hypothetical protein